MVDVYVPQQLSSVLLLSAWTEPDIALPVWPISALRWVSFFSGSASKPAVIRYPCGWAFHIRKLYFTFTLHTLSGSHSRSSSLHTRPPLSHTHCWQQRHPSERPSPMNGCERLLGHSSGRPLLGQWGPGPGATQELGTCSGFSAPFIKTLSCPLLSPPFANLTFLCTWNSSKLVKAPNQTQWAFSFFFPPNLPWVELTSLYILSAFPTSFPPFPHSSKCNSESRGFSVHLGIFS